MFQKEEDSGHGRALETNMDELLMKYIAICLSLRVACFTVKMGIEMGKLLTL